MDVKEAIKTAIQMEKDGYDFYIKAAAQTSSTMGQQIFSSLAQDEKVHLATFQRMFDDKVGKEEWGALVVSSKKYATQPVFPKDLEAVAGANPDSNELDALNMAIEAEKHAIDFYNGIKDELDDPEVIKIIAEIIHQEESHFLLLSEEFAHLNQTGFWYDVGPLGE